MLALVSSSPWARRTPLPARADKPKAHQNGSQLGTEALLSLGLAGTFPVSVGGWLIATASQRLWGDAIASIRLTVLTRDGNPPPEGCMWPGTAVFGPECPAADRPLGNSVGAIGWPLGAAPRLAGRPAWSGFANRVAPTLVTKLRPSGGSPPQLPREARRGSG
jgi:hypothetical protein